MNQGPQGPSFFYNTAAGPQGRRAAEKKTAGPQGRRKENRRAAGPQSLENFLLVVWLFLAYNRTVNQKGLRYEISYHLQRA